MQLFAWLNLNRRLQDEKMAVYLGVFASTKDQVFKIMLTKVIYFYDIKLLKFRWIGTFHHAFFLKKNKKKFSLLV